jgi:hypothetical protein
VERSFADSKQLHGHCYATFRGIGKVFEQCLPCAAAQNMKKIALVVDKKDILRLLRLLEQYLATVKKAYSSLYAFISIIRQFDPADINPLIRENPA